MMRFLTDQDVYWETVLELRALGHDVTNVKEMGLQRASDEKLPKAAGRANRLLSRQKHVGN